MAKTTKTDAPQTTATPSALEAIASKLDALAAEATAMGEDRTAKVIGWAIKSARWAHKQRAAQQKRAGSIVTAMKSKGMSDAEIVAKLTQ